MKKMRKMITFLKFITYSLIGIIGVLLAFLIIVKIEEANYRAELYKKRLDRYNDRKSKG